MRLFSIYIKIHTLIQFLLFFSNVPLLFLYNTIMLHRIHKALHHQSHHPTHHPHDKCCRLISSLPNYIKAYMYTNIYIYEYYCINIRVHSDPAQSKPPPPAAHKRRLVLFLFANTLNGYRPVWRSVVII